MSKTAEDYWAEWSTSQTNGSRKMTEARFSPLPLHWKRKARRIFGRKSYLTEDYTMVLRMTIGF
jgi:hypothetical protein